MKPEKLRLLKVVMWRCISVSVTMIVMAVTTGSIKSASSITLVLHGILLSGHYLFESCWEKYIKIEVISEDR